MSSKPPPFIHPSIHHHGMALDTPTSRASKQRPDEDSNRLHHGAAVVGRQPAPIHCMHIYLCVRATALTQRRAFPSQPKRLLTRLCMITAFAAGEEHV